MQAGPGAVLNIPPTKHVHFWLGVSKFWADFGQESHQDANGKHEALAKKLDDKMRMKFWEKKLFGIEWSTHKKS